MSDWTPTLSGGACHSSYCSRRLWAHGTCRPEPPPPGDSESLGRRVSLLFNENPRLLHMKVLYLCVLLASFQYQGQSYRLGSWKHIGFFPGQHSKSHVGFCNSKRTPIRPNLAVLVGSASAASESLSQQKSLLSWDLLDAGQADTNSSTDDDVEHWEV